MNATIISIGTEILLGEITDTNAVYISKMLALYGINVYKRITVGDNAERFKRILNMEYADCDIIITTGGLGPTADDLSKEAACEYFDVPMIFHKDIYDDICGYFERSGKAMSQNNKKQAYLPKDCTVMYNPNGTAPGFILEKQNKTLIMFPGPPKEMIPMFESYAIPYFEKISNQRVFTKNILTYGISESEADKKLGTITDFFPEITYATYAYTGMVRVRLGIKFDRDKHSPILEKAVEKAVELIGGKYVYSTDAPDMQTALVELLKANNITVSTAESCTGGLISKLITDVSGASTVFECGICSYSNRIKSGVLNVSEDILSEYGAVSHQTAIQMAENVRNIVGSDIALSVTGLAGPQGDERKPVGLVYIGISSKRGTFSKEFNFCRGRIRTRDDIRILSANAAFALAIDEIKSIKY
ncbi:MAG: competence/damage-inducible protein A [Clostridiales bacterium]|nr:competence/damage-inducible protein A [Clostridiales bacterium]